MDAIDISHLFGQEIDELQVSIAYDNTNATVGADDPSKPECFFDNLIFIGVSPPDISLENTMWFSFTGDGSYYYLSVNPCGLSPNMDTQAAIYTGGCNDLTLSWCSEDGPESEVNGPYPAGGIFNTEAGVEYLIMIDGATSIGGVTAGATNVGEFCFNIRKLESITCTEMHAGTLSILDDNICFDTILETEYDDNDSPIVPFSTFNTSSGFFWFITDEEPTLEENPVLNPGYLGSFGASSEYYDIGFLNDLTQIPAGEKWFVPFFFGEVETDLDGNLDFSTGCTTYGTVFKTYLHGEYDDLSIRIEQDSIASALEVIVLGGSGDYSYEWNTGDTTKTIGYVDDLDLYEVTVIDNSGCAASEIAFIETGTSFTDELTSFDIKVYPNPAVQQLNIEWTNTAKQFLEYSVVNLSGKTMVNKSIDIRANAISLDVNDYESGLYILLMTTREKEVLRNRFVVCK